MRRYYGASGYVPPKIQHEPTPDRLAEANRIRSNIVRALEERSRKRLYVGAPTLDERGRCYGRKPLHYKGGSWCSPSRPMKFCDREFDPATGAQRENWAWGRIGDKWVRRAGHEVEEWA